MRGVNPEWYYGWDQEPDDDLPDTNDGRPADDLHHLVADDAREAFLNPPDPLEA